MAASRLALALDLGAVHAATVPPDEVSAGSVLITGASSIIVSGAEAVGMFDALTIVTSKTFQIASVADDTPTIGTGVTAWTDRSGLARNWSTAGAGSTQAAYTANDATLYNRASMRFNGTSSYLPNAWNPPSTVTTPTFYRIIAKHLSRVATNGTLIGSGTSNRFGVFDSAVSPNVHAIGTSASADCSMTIGTWFVVDALLDSAAGYLHIGGVTQSAALGTNDPGGIVLGAIFTGASAFGAYDVAAVFALNGEPTGGELTAWNAHIAKYYGGSVTLPT